MRWLVVVTAALWIALVVLVRGVGAAECVDCTPVVVIGLDAVSTEVASQGSTLSAIATQVALPTSTPVPTATPEPTSTPNPTVVAGGIAATMTATSSWSNREDLRDMASYASSRGQFYQTVLVAVLLMVTTVGVISRWLK